MLKATVQRAVVGVIVLFCGADRLSAQELNWAQKMFDSLEHDFGVVARGSTVRHSIKVTNIYQQPVHIASVRTTCGCSAATPSTHTLASRETASIDVTMDTQRFTRQKDSNLIVTFDSPLYAEVRIPIRAYIRTDVVLTPGEVNFGPVDQGSSVERRVTVSYAGRNNWAIRDVKTGSEHLSAKVVETGRSAGRVNYDLLVTLEPSAPVGALRHMLTLVTDDAGNPQVPVLVEARVEADITVTPSVVSFGMVAPGQTKTVNVVLRGKKPFAIERIECETDLQAFKVRLPEAEKQVHILPLTVTPPDKPGAFTEEFTVTIAGRDEPLVFKAYGKVVGPGEN